MTKDQLELNKYLGSWAARDSKDNALATASQAGEADKKHYITGVAAGYSAAKVGLLQIKDGATVIFEHYVNTAFDLSFPAPLKGTSGNAVSAELAASGAAGNIGKVNLIGFTA